MKEGIGESAVVQRMRSGTIASNSNLNRQAGGSGGRVANRQTVYVVCCRPIDTLRNMTYPVLNPPEGGSETVRTTNAKHIHLVSS